MKFTSMIGVVLIVLGVAALAYQGINYTTRDRPRHRTGARDR